MRLHHPAICLLLAASAAGPAPAQEGAQDRTVAVEVPADATSKTETGTLSGGQKITYTIDARSGHSASVHLKANNASCTFLIYGPGQTPGRNAAMYNSAVSGNGFSGFLPSTGTYLVEIGLGAEAARYDQTCDYTITFAVAR